MKFWKLYIVVIMSALGCQDKPVTKNTPQKVVIAHRGASGYLPEHTLQ